ncbi:MAG: SAM-dependent methyltransferase [Bacteroides sp.]|nr:SAM-dependent methyltransferase [Bacteroides sp.]
MKKPQFINLIRQGDFKELFISELGWNRYRGHAQLPSILIDEKEYDFTTIAERSGFQVLYSEVDEIPTQSLARKIDTKLRRQANDYICIYRLRGTAHDLWVVPVRTNEKRDLVVVEYDNANAEAVYQKIDGITFGFDEKTNIVDLRSKVQAAFAINSEKITKDFYAGFKKQHKAFAELISGIDDHIAVNDNRNKQWYASVILNRLMFCYFIQKKGFLDLDVEYLRNKLNFVRANAGEDKFYNFYRSFLRRLFHDGLNTPGHSRDFENVFGKIPYLNGGMFEEHQIEVDYADIDIPDDAFISLFDFFDKWNWHLDTRLTASGRDINPDVLGYIFEQYINDRAQMGAYYTKEDITEYIGRNCILPFLFDKVRKATADSQKAFLPDGFVWKSLRESGDRYIFDAVKKGYRDFRAIPKDISRGIITGEMRKEYSETPVGDLPETHIPLAELRSEWNTRTPEPWGLPNEIWRETIERLQRCDDILGKIQNGEITSINDFITYNLDIRSFAADLLAKADNRFVGWFYHALQEVTVLDPTCGSGAFLFAAMNILEPLYEICIYRMQELNQDNSNFFKKELAEITDKYRSNIQYFIFKSIILRNLYGVDIMVEATEIAKLRLFLKMVAVVDVDRRAPNLGLDPLPDIDFNIRCGNTLVGYATKEQLNRDLGHSDDILQELANQDFREQIEEEMDKVARVYEIFKDVQLRQSEDMLAFKQAKSNLRDRLAELNDKLNRRLFLATTGVNNDQGIDFTGTQAYRDWLSSHQPFHWLAEFYQIIEGNGGFDVIIGNPPYVEISKNEISYILTGIPYKDLYAYVLERSLSISKNEEFLGFIIPISFNSTPGFNEIYQKYSRIGIYISCYADTAKMFQVTKRLSIILKVGKCGDSYITKYIKCNMDMGIRLAAAPYMNVSKNIIRFDNIPAKISNKVEENLIEKYFKNSEEISKYINKKGEYIYYTRAIRNFRPFFDFIPCHKNPDGSDKIPTETKSIVLVKSMKRFLLSLLNSNLTFLLFSWFTDVRNINPGLINKLRVPIVSSSEELKSLSVILMEDYKRNRETRYNKSNRCVESYYFPVKSKLIIDEIDKVLARHYGFTDEELDFIINYDIKYRMGDELNNGD